MPDRVAIERGFSLERDVAAALELRQVPGSGSQWHSRSDDAGRGLRVSCKSTSKRSWSQTRKDLADAVDMAAGTGELPALVVEDDDGQRFVIMRLADFAARELTESSVTPRRAERVRKAAHTPLLLRGD